MTKISTILIDDETAGRIVLRELLIKFCPEVEILAEAASIDQAYLLINELKPDFIFLDIQMPGGSGFDLLKRFTQINFNVIFVTSFDKYAITAIKFSALDYLLKPVEVQEMKNCIEKAIERKSATQKVEPLIVNLIQNLSDDMMSRRLAVHTLNNVRFISLFDIIRCEADDNYTQVFTIHLQKHVIARTLKDLSSYLEGNPNFIRINRSVIINTEHIDYYSKGDDCTIYMKDKSSFKLNRNKKAEVKSKLP